MGEAIPPMSDQFINHFIKPLLLLFIIPSLPSIPPPVNKKAVNIPQVEVLGGSTSDPYKLFTLIMTDPDAPDPKHPTHKGKVG